MKELDELIEKYENGSLSESELASMRELLKRQTDVKYKYWSDYLSAAENAGKEKMHADPFEKIPQENDAAVILMRQDAFFKLLKYAAGVAVTIGLFTAGYFAGRNHSGGEVAAMKEDIDLMKKIVAMQQITNSSASERIKAVGFIGEVAAGDPKIMEALVNTLKGDENMNVRIVAAEALGRYSGEENVRQALMSVLASEQDPALQITLIDILVHNGERRALPHLQKLIQDVRVIDPVKEKANEGIGTLL